MRFIGIGFNIVTMIMLGVIAGYFIDEKFGFTPKGIIIGTIFGCLCALVYLFRMASES